MRTPVLINLKTTIRIESEFDKVNIEKKKKQSDFIESIKVKFFEPHTTAELNKVYKLLFNTPSTSLYVPIKEELDRRKNERTKR